MPITKTSVWSSASTAFLQHCGGEANCMLFNPSVCPLSGNNDQLPSLHCAPAETSIPSDWQDHFQGWLENNTLGPTPLSDICMYLHLWIYMCALSLSLYLLSSIFFLISREILTKNSRWKNSLQCSRHPVALICQGYHIVRWCGVRCVWRRMEGSALEYSHACAHV